MTTTENSTRLRADAWRLNVLGPVELCFDGQPVAVTGITRTLLALLARAPGEEVNTASIVAGIWGSDPPEDSEKEVAVNISRLRRALTVVAPDVDPTSVVVTMPAGYILAVEPANADILAFERLTTDGRRALAVGQPALAVARLEAALALWRGRAYEDFDDGETRSSAVTAEAARLEDLRLAAIESMMEARLAEAAPSVPPDLVTDLPELLERHWHRERLWIHWLTALFRLGRRTDALAAYRRAEKLLTDQLSAEPGPELRAAERAVNASDRELYGHPLTEAYVPSALAMTVPACVGRDEELGWLSGALDLAATRRAQARLIVGSPGTGKTRIVAELAQRAAVRGITAHYWPSDTSGLELFAPDPGVVTLVVIEDIDQTSHEDVARVTNFIRSTLSRPVVTLLTCRDPVRVGDLASLPKLVLSALDDDAVAAIVRVYAPTVNHAMAVAAMASTGGVPARVHRAASEWAFARAGRRIDRAVADATQPSRRLAALSDEVVGGVLDLAHVRAQARPLRPTVRELVARPYKGLSSFDASDTEIFHGRDQLVAELVARLVERRLLAVVGAAGTGKSSLIRAGLLPALAAGVLPTSARWRQVIVRPGVGGSLAEQLAPHLDELRRIEAPLAGGDQRGLLGPDEFFADAPTASSFDAGPGDEPPGYGVPLDFPAYVLPAYVPNQRAAEADDERRYDRGDVDGHYDRGGQAFEPVDPPPTFETAELTETAATSYVVYGSEEDRSDEDLAADDGSEADGAEEAGLDDDLTDNELTDDELTDDELADGHPMGGYLAEKDRAGAGWADPPPAGEQWAYRDSAVDPAPDEGPEPADYRSESFSDSPPETVPLPGQDSILLVVDQFEEVFTVLDEAERVAFLSTVVQLVDSHRVVLTVRADFYARCADHVELAELLSANTVLVRPMTVDEMCRAIELPAAAAGLRVEDGLARRIAGEARAQPDLAHLSTALYALWEHRVEATLTLDAYHATGGVAAALENLAETALRPLPTVDERDAARRIMLCLCSASDAGIVSGRRASLAEVVASAGPAAPAVLEKLVAGRLVSVSEGSVEVAHEAVLENWPRLHRWLGDARAEQTQYDHLAEAARAWTERDDTGALYRGARLAAALDLVRQRELRPIEHDFLAASQRLVLAADIRRRRRSVRLWRYLVAAIVVAILAIAVAAVAVTLQLQAAAAGERADGQRLAALAVAEPDLRKALLLAVAATQLDDNAAQTIHTVLLGSPDVVAAAGHDVSTVALSPDGTTVAAATRDGTIWLYRADSLRETGRLDLAGQGPVNGLAFTQDGRRLVSWGGAHNATNQPSTSIVEWDLTAKRPNGSPFGQPWPDAGGGLLADGVTLLLAQHGSGPNEPPTAVAWNIEARTPSTAYQLPTSDITGIQLSPDGRYVVLGGSDGVHVIDTTGGTTTFIAGAANPLAISPDGRTLLTADGADVGVWDVPGARRTGQAVRHSGAVAGAAWSPDATRFASVAADGLVIVWDASTLQPVKGLAGHGGPVRVVRFGADGRMLYTVGADGSLFAWDLSGTRGVAAKGEPTGDVTASVALACQLAGRDLTPQEWQTYLPDRSYRHVCPA